MPQAVTNLKKVSLAVTMPQSTPGDARSSAAVLFTFIYGIGSYGLTPFEQALAGKKKGESLSVQVNGAQMQEYFGALLLPLQQHLGLLSLPDYLDLHLTITKVGDAGSREFVKYMATMAGHGGCGGSCGCGCS